MTRDFGWMSVVRLGMVQACLGAVVVMTTSTLNRVMVVELALPALLPGLLVAMHYLVQVLRPRMGHGSDLGGRRTPWIVGGMAVLATGGALAAVATAWMGTDRTAGVALAVVAFALIGVGVSACGTALLVLLAKRVEPSRRAGAATVVWLMMILGFALTAGIAGRLLDPYTPLRLIEVCGGVSALAFGLTVLAMFGLEGAAGASPAPAIGAAAARASTTDTCRSASTVPASATVSAPATALRPAAIEAAAPSPSASALPRAAAAARPTPFRQALAEVWAEPVARRFTVFVFLSMLAYSAQDLILEPFAGLVFGFTPGQSTGLSGVQHGGVLVGMLAAAAAGRGRFGSLRAWQIGGCLLSAAMLLALVVAAAVGPAWPFRATVFALGAANGAFSIAAIASMMRLAGEGGPAREGVRMGLWGAAQAVAFGLGGIVGTAASDLARWMLGSPAAAYAAVFALEALLFIAAAVLAGRIGQAATPASRPVPRATVRLSLR